MRQDKQKAISFRKQGKSYNEIVKILNVPKSTLSYWLRDIKMPLLVQEKFWNETRRKWAQNITKFNKKRARIARERACKIRELAAKDIARLSNKELFLIGVALYWAEGHKKSRWQTDFSNSDPFMIKLMMKFFRTIMNIPEDKFFATAQIHPNVTSKEAVKYWSQITRIPKNQFLKTYSRLTPTSKRKRAPTTLPYGTLRLSVSGVEPINKIKGWIAGLERLA